MTRRIFLLILVLLLGSILVFRFSGGSTEQLWSWSRGGTWLLPLVTVAALIDSINPCAFSILLLTLAFLFSLGRLRSDALKIGLGYIAGIFAAYLLIGLGLLQVLHLFSTQHFMAKLGAALLVVLGIINILGDLFPKFPIRLQLPGGAHRRMAVWMERASLPFAFLLGGLVGLCEFPCTGGPYLMVLGLLHDQTTYVRGTMYLLLYNLLFIAPLLLTLLAASDPVLLGRVQEWRKRNLRHAKLWSGVAMIVLALLIILL